MAGSAPIILVLEDEPLISIEIETILAAGGFDVRTSSSCVGAKGLLDRFRPDVVIVDIELSDGDCDAAVEQMIEEDIPFVVYSGDPAVFHAGTPFARGKWVEKPAAADVLLVAVALALECAAGVGPRHPGTPSDAVC